MKAFSVAWRALVDFYNDLFFLFGMSLLWWACGGIFAGAAFGAAWILLRLGGPWWLAPLLAMPAGPASAALAHVARRTARDLHADHTFYLEGVRSYWRQALALSAISMVILCLLLLNLVFYATQTAVVLWLLTFLWVYLSAFWVVTQIYLYPVLVGLEVPSVRGALRMAAAMTLANPLFSLILLLVAGLLTGISTLLVIPILVAWPAVIVLMGEGSVKLFVEQAAQRSS
jgi:uncharacterized membrane protein YesL